MSAPLHPLVAVVGPTGSGKSDLGLALAERFPAEIVNCDSVQLYRHLDIGSAKVPVSERRGIPHHMIDVADPDEFVSAGDYARRARDVLRAIAEAGRTPIVVGGTGFYLRALIDGLFDGPARDEDLRRRLRGRERREPGSLHRILARLDPESAQRIHAADVNKVMRALEVRLLTRRPISEMFREGTNRLTGFRTLKIGLDPPREHLYGRLDQRTARMFDSGLVEEVAAILRRGFPAESRALGSLGYRQALQVLSGELSREEAIALTQRDTRRYAKRQRTWFRREPDVVWLTGFGVDSAVQREACECAERFLCRRETVC